MGIKIQQKLIKFRGFSLLVSWEESVVEAESRVTEILSILQAVSWTACGRVAGRGMGSSCIINNTRQWALASMAVYDSKYLFDHDKKNE